MKKNVFYIPAIFYTLFYGLTALVFGGIGAIQPIVIAWLFLFWLAGILLSKAIWWGGLLGMLPAAYFIYMSTQGTGQIAPIELPLGIIVLLFYAGCTYIVYKKKSQSQQDR